jgi:hypothetical protein
MVPCQGCVETGLRPSRLSLSGSGWAGPLTAQRVGSPAHARAQGPFRPNHRRNTGCALASVVREWGSSGGTNGGTSGGRVGGRRRHCDGRGRRAKGGCQEERCGIGPRRAARRLKGEPGPAPARLGSAGLGRDSARAAPLTPCEAVATAVFGDTESGMCIICILCNVGWDPHWC